MPHGIKGTSAMRVNARAFSVSVIIEWYNVTHAESGRASRMLQALESQAAALRSPDGNSRVCLSAPLDLVVVYDSDRLGAPNVSAAVRQLAGTSAALAPRFLPVANSTYCRMKNAGAAVANGEIIIFLDSDVIPEPGWLRSMLEALSREDVTVVVGNTYVDLGNGGTYPKSMALTWMFPLREPGDDLTPSKCFYANNVAFRRETFLSRTFPDVAGLIHAAAGLLVERLELDGIVIWHSAGARASHPPPNGPRHFAARAISAGRARALSETTATIASTAKWLREDLQSVGFGCKRLVGNGSEVGLRWWQLPSAVAIAAAYYGLLHAGSWMTLLLPGLMRNRFQL